MSSHNPAAGTSRSTRLIEAARQKYIDGEIEVDEFERQIASAIETRSSWCVVHGTPGRDPLTVSGPFYDESAAQAAASAAVEKRPDVAAIVDMLLHPEDPEAATKHESYDEQPTDVLARVRELIDAVEQELERREIGILSPAERDDLLDAEPSLAAGRATGSSVDVQLREAVGRLLLVRDRLARSSG